MPVHKKFRNRNLTAVLSIVLGVLVLAFPHILQYLIAIYLIVYGVLTLSD